MHISFLSTALLQTSNFLFYYFQALLERLVGQHMYTLLTTEGQHGKLGGEGLS